MNRPPAPKQAVRAAFDKAADAYDAVAAVQREACDRLLTLVQANGITPRWILDGGCGTGYALPHLHRTFPSAQLLALDFAPAMLRRHPPGIALPLCGDLEHLPLANDSLDAVWSSYALQWCHPDKAFPELARVLHPGGQAWIATLGPGTLQELRNAFRVVDEAEHVLSFSEPDVLAASLETAGLRVRHHRRDTLRAWAPDLRQLLSDIKALGAHQTGAGRRRPLTKTAWHRLSEAYEVHRSPLGLPASYDTLWFIAEKT